MKIRNLYLFLLFVDILSMSFPSCTIFQHGYHPTELDQEWFYTFRGSRRTNNVINATCNGLLDLTSIFSDGDQYFINDRKRIFNANNFTFQNVSITTTLDNLLPLEHRGWTIKIIYFSGENIELQKISKGGFEDLDIQNINLGRNNLSVIDEHYFNALTELESLDLSNNRIHTIHGKALSNNPKLKSLYLNNNKIGSFKPPLFDAQLSLEILDLSSNPVVYIDAYLLQNTNQLKFLNLSDLSLTNLSVIKSKTNLQKLDCKYNNISIIDEEVFKNMVNMIWLDLSHNSIKQLPKSFYEDMIYLQNLSLRYNHVSNLNFHSQNSFRILDLSFNGEQNLPFLLTWISSQLQELYLENGNYNLENFIFNRISKVLLKLYLGYNNIKTISSGIFNNLLLLELIDVSFNRVSFIDPDAFLNLPMLRMLSLKGNRLQQISPHLFRSTINMKFLDLSLNDLSEISIGTLDSCSHLVSLNLSYNHIKNVTKFNLYPLKSLEQLYISNNDLSEIEGIYYLHMLKIISMQDNNWNCDYLFNIIAFCDSQSIKISGRSANLTKEHLRWISCTNQTQSSMEYNLVTTDCTKCEQNLEDIRTYVMKMFGDIKDNLRNMSLIFKGREEFSGNQSRQLSSGKSLQDNSSDIYSYEEHDSFGSMVPMFYIIILLGICLLSLSCFNAYLKMSKRRKKEGQPYSE